MSLTQDNQWLNGALLSAPGGQMGTPLEMPHLPGQLPVTAAPSPSDPTTPYSATSFDLGMPQVGDPASQSLPGHGNSGSGTASLTGATTSSTVVRKWPYWKQISEEEFKARNERRCASDGASVRSDSRC